MNTSQRIAKLAAELSRAFQSGQLIGFGSGSTAEAVVQALAERQQTEPGFTVTGVATSLRTAELARSLSIPIVDLGDVNRIDIGFDGADEIDPALNLVKGKGGALLYEKLVAAQCDDYIVVSSDEKCVSRLGTRLPLPIEVIPYGWVHTAARLQLLGLEPTLRMVNGASYVTDAGNVILDCIPSPGLDLLALAPTIKGQTGVVEHGIFPGMARRAMLVDQTGTVRTELPK